MRVSVRWLVVGVSLWASGCGNSDRKDVFPARGKIVDAAGKPVVGATIVLHPVAGGSAAHKPGGTSNAEGEFVLTTYAQDDGAPLGDYVATVEWCPAPKNPGDDPPDRLKGRFRSADSSPFKMSVTKGDNQLPTITLP